MLTARRSSSSSLASCLPSLLVSQGSAACRDEQRETVSLHRMHRRRGPRGPRRFSFHPSPTSRHRMAIHDVLIFDTTLRDGEQAPGNSLSPEEKLRLARQLDALGVDVIEAGFPAASEGDYRSVREIADRDPAAGHRRAGALPRARHRARRRGARAPRRGAGSTSSSPPPTCTSGTSSRPPREDVLALARAAIRQARALHRRRRVLAPRTPAAPTPTSSAAWSRRPSQEGATHRQPARHRRLRHARRSTARCSATCWPRVPGADARRAERALPRRPRPRRGQLARRDRGRRAAGGVHRQRHRRARRQRRPGGDGDGEPGARAGAGVPLQRGDPRDLPHQPAALLPHRRLSPAQQGDRRPQRLRPRGRASTSTACCRTG